MCMGSGSGAGARWRGMICKWEGGDIVLGETGEYISLPEGRFAENGESSRHSLGAGPLIVRT
jgi:hypothetical protein